jgi:C1A family cysteine protease
MIWMKKKWKPIYLVNTGPLAIAINADQLQFYDDGGIVDADACECDPEGLNHGVTLIGYGTENGNGKDFWIIKNTWREGWGESGYFRMAINKDTCGVNKYVSTAKIFYLYYLK